MIGFIGREERGDVKEDEDPKTPKRSSWKLDSRVFGNALLSSLHCSFILSFLWKIISSPMALRSHALDAVAFDREVSSLLRAAAERAALHLGASLAHAIKPELHLALDAAMHLLSFSANKPTPGQRMHNLRVCGRIEPDDRGPAIRLPPRAAASAAAADAVAPSRLSTGRRLAHFALVVLLPWLWARLHRALAETSRPDVRQWWRLVRRLDAVVSCLGLACSVRHLVDGGFATLPMAMLGMRMSYARNHAPRVPDLEYTSQELAWRSFADLAVSLQSFCSGGVRTIASTLGLSGLTIPESVRRTLRFARESILPSLLLPPPQVDSPPPPPRGACGLCCSEPMHTGCVATCGHAFCYYCLTMACLREVRTPCPRCGVGLSFRGRQPIAQSEPDPCSQQDT